jgi:hypothetical protein
MGNPLTNINGLEFNSEFRDPVLYNVVRTLQFLFLHTYKLGLVDDLTIEETNKDKFFLYSFENKILHLRGYIGRCEKKQKIRYLAMDTARLRWVETEGFEPTSENYDKIGVMLSFPSLNDFLLFMAGRGGWDSLGYVRSADFHKEKTRKRKTKEENP